MAKKKKKLVNAPAAEAVAELVWVPEPISEVPEIQEVEQILEGDVFYAIRDPMRGGRQFVVSEVNYKRQMDSFRQRPPKGESAEKAYEAWRAAITVRANSAKEAAEKLRPS